jgi:hypothetical protein
MCVCVCGAWLVHYIIAGFRHVVGCKIPGFEFSAREFRTQLLERNEACVSINTKFSLQLSLIPSAPLFRSFLQLHH